MDETGKHQRLQRYGARVAAIVVFEPVTARLTDDALRAVTAELKAAINAPDLLAVPSSPPQGRGEVVTFAPRRAPRIPDEPL